jgi:CRP/FNR family transcriptional regulator, cyclic AMP receptor protein
VLLKIVAQASPDPVGLGRCRTYKQGDTVFLQGDPADAVFYIREGQVHLAATSPQGRKATMGTLGAGDFFGDGCLAGQALYTTTATAAGDAAIVKIEKSEMVEGLRDQPGLSQLFMAFLLSRHIQLQAELVDHIFNSD